MGYFYVGYNNLARKNGVLKIGETGGTISKRINAIKKNETFKILGFIEMENSTKSERLFVESYVRQKLSKEKEFTHFGNDHFSYIIDKDNKEKQIANFTEKIKNYAFEAIDLL